MAAVLFVRLAQVDMVHVPFKGGAPAVQSVLAGDTQLAFATPPSVLPLVQAGRLKALAITSRNATPLIPGVPLPAPLISVTTIAVVAAVNVRGTRDSATVQNWTTGAKVGVLTFLSLVLIARGGGAAAESTGPVSVPNASLAAGIGAAMIGVLWAYEGWQYVTFSAGEAKDPQRTFPRAISIAKARMMAIMPQLVTPQLVLRRRQRFDRVAGGAETGPPRPRSRGGEATGPASRSFVSIIASSSLRGSGNSPPCGR